MAEDETDVDLKRWKKVNRFFANSEQCVVCQRIVEQGTKSRHWKELVATSRAGNEVEDWLDVLRAGAIADVPNYFAREGKIFATVKVNYRDLPRINNTAGISDGDQTISQQPKSSYSGSGTQCGAARNLYDKQSLKPLDHLAIHRCALNCCCIQKGNATSVQDQSCCSLWFRHCCSCYLYSHHVIIIHKIDDSEDHGHCELAIEHEKTERRTSVDDNGVSGLPAVKFSVDNDQDHDGIRADVGAGCDPAEQVALTKQPLSVSQSKVTNQEQASYHIFEFTGNGRCCGQDLCLHPHVDSSLANPCCLCCCKCYASNTINKSFDGQNFDVVFYKGAQFDAVDVLETLAQAEEQHTSCVWGGCGQCSCHGYDCLVNNCEHLATRSRIGISKSAQINKCREYVCVYMARTLHVWLLRLLLLLTVILKSVDINLDFSWRVDLALYVITFVLALLAQITIVTSIIDEQRNYGNELLHLVRWKHGGVCFLRLLSLFVALALAFSMKYAVENNLIVLEERKVMIIEIVLLSGAFLFDLFLARPLWNHCCFTCCLLRPSSRLKLSPSGDSNTKQSSGEARYCCVINCCNGELQCC